MPPPRAATHTPTPAPAAPLTPTGLLAGQTVVVTGTLMNHDRKGIETLIGRHGGTSSSSVTKTTTLVVAGDDAGAKLDRAKALGIRVVSEAEFEALVGHG